MTVPLKCFLANIGLQLLYLISVQARKFILVLHLDIILFFVTKLVAPENGQINTKKLNVNTGGLY